MKNWSVAEIANTKYFEHIVSQTGLYYYGFRYYAAWLCRFVSVDPLQFEYPQLTPYNYAGNKSVTHIDIDGLQSTGDEKRNQIKEVGGGQYFDGIQIFDEAVVYGNIPETHKADVSGAIDIGDYTLLPHYSKMNGKDMVSYYTATYYDGDESSLQYVVGPGQVDEFKACVDEFEFVPDSLFETNENRTAIEWYKDITNEEEAMNDFFNNPSLSTWWTFGYKRALSQFTNPLNYLRLKAGSPRVFKAKVKGSIRGFNTYRKENPLPSNMSFKGKGSGSVTKAYQSGYRRSLEKKAENIGSYYDNVFNTTVVNVKTTYEVLNKKRNE